MSTEPHTVHHITLHGPWMTACGVDASPGQLSAGEAWSSDWPDVTCRNCLQAELPRLRSLADAGEKVAEALESVRRIVMLSFDDQSGPMTEKINLALAAYTAAKGQSEP